MRARLSILLSAVLLAVMAMPALAQYPPGSSITPDNSFTCTEGETSVTAVVGGLLPGTQGTVTITFATGESATGTGTVDNTGAMSVDIAFPAGASGPNGCTLSGTAGTGESVDVLGAFIERAAPAGTPPVVAATGAESGVLALIALGLVAAGGGAVLLARRKTHAEV